MFDKIAKEARRHLTDDLEGAAGLIRFTPALWDDPQTPKNAACLGNSGSSWVRIRVNSIHSLKEFVGATQGALIIECEEAVENLKIW